MGFPMFGGDITNYAQWKAYLSQHLSTEQRGILKRGWPRSRWRFEAELAATAERLRGPDPIVRGAIDKTVARLDPERLWALGVLAINVQLKPAGRAVLQGPGTTYRIEIYWVKTGKPERGKESPQSPKSVHVIGEPIVGIEAQPDLNAYFTAFFLHLSGISPPDAFKRAPRARPAPGQPPDTDFYRQLIAAEEALRTRYKAPAKELARRYGEEYATVRTWLSRGRRYVEKEEQ